MASYALALALLAGLGAILGLLWPYWLALAAAAGMTLHHYWLIRGRSRDGCFRAFQHSNWIGLAIFAGIAASFELQYRP